MSIHSTTNALIIIVISKNSLSYKNYFIIKYHHIAKHLNKYFTLISTLKLFYFILIMLTKNLHQFSMRLILVCSTRHAMQHQYSTHIKQKCVVFVGFHEYKSRLFDGKLFSSLRGGQFVTYIIIVI